MQASIVIPVLNEAGLVGSALDALAPLREAGAEVVVVDGGSIDGTAVRARAGADQVLSSPPGRARQMNAGAAAARGALLVFLHVDTRLPTTALDEIRDGLERTERGWGRFDVRLSGPGVALRVIERLISLRSRLTGIATGDQVIFVRRDWFERAGGYPPLPLMEDVALSKALGRVGRPLCLRATVVTSSRRWESAGITRTVLLMWWLRLAFALGVAPRRLAAWYRAGARD